jgi:Ca2+-binding EF-hand superfamily protein
MFKVADINNDGVLSRDELESSEDLGNFYTADENVANVPQSKFLSDCTG